MALCKDIFAFVLLAVVVQASNDAAKVPLPYASASYELETNHLTDQDASASSHIQQYDSSPEGYQVQSGIESYIVPALTSYHVKPGIIEHIKPYAYKLIAILPKVLVAAVAVLGLVVVGTLLTTCICAYTSLCHLTFLGHRLTSDSVRGFLTQDKISELAQFLEKSIHSVKRSIEAKKEVKKS